MSTPVDAEQAWKDLQRIRIPQERVYDEVERSASGDDRASYAVAATMWVFLLVAGLDLPLWGVLLACAAYVALLGVVGVFFNRRNRMRLHHSRYNWRMSASFAAGAVVSGGTVLLSGHLVESLDPLVGSLIRATVTAAVFLLFSGPANRWAVGSLRDRAARAGAGG